MITSLMIILLLFFIAIIACLSILIIKEIIIVFFKVFLRYAHWTASILMTEKVTGIISDIDIKILTFAITVKIRFNV